MRWYPCVLLAAGAVAPQQARDAGTFVVTVNGAAKGREEFSIRDGRGTAPGGYTVTVRRFSAEGGDPILLATIELGPDSQFSGAQISEAARERRTYIQASPRRVTVRGVTPGGESVREYPGGPAIWLADDVGVSWFLFPPPPGTMAVTLLWPWDDRREAVELTDHGVESTDVGSASRALRHISVGTGTGERHLWYDERGRLIKVEAPATGLVATRAGMP